MLRVEVLSDLLTSRVTYPVVMHHSRPSGGTHKTRQHDLAQVPKMKAVQDRRIECATGEVAQLTPHESVLRFYLNEPIY